MADLKYEVIFAAIDRLSATVKSVGNAFTEMNARIKDTGENLLKAGAAIGGIGAAGLVGLKYVIDPAIEAQGEMAHLATAMQDGAAQAKHLAEVEEVTNAAAEKGVITTENLREAYYLARSNGLDHAKALEAVAASADLVTGTTENAAAANAAMADTTRTLTGVSNIYNANLHNVADSLSLLQTKYAFKDITEITDALKFVAPVAKGAGVGFNEAAASIAVLSQNMQIGGRAGEVYRQVLLTFEKGGAHGRLLPFRREDARGNFDLIASLAALREHLAALGPTARNAFLSEAGMQARSIVGAEILLDQYGKINAIQADMDKSAGAAAANATTRQAAADEQVAETINSWNVLRETIGKTLVVSFGDWLGKLHAGIIAITEWVKQNPELVKQIATWVAVGSAILVVLGVVTALAGSFLILAAFIGSLGIGTVIFGAIAAVIATVAAASYGVYEHWVTIRTLFATLWTDVKDVTSAFGSWIEAWAPTIGKVLLVSIGGPFGMLALLIYQHWDKVRAFFKTVLVEMKDLGLDLLKALGEGLLDGLSYLAGPLGTVARFVIDHFKGHSPPPLGPLHDLNRIRIVETIAQTIRPDPLSHVVADAAASLLPLSSFAALRLGSLGSGFYGDQFGHLAGIRGNAAGGITIHLDYHPSFGAGTSITDMDAKQHAKIIMAQINDAMWRDNRLRFDH